MTITWGSPDFPTPPSDSVMDHLGHLDHLDHLGHPAERPKIPLILTWLHGFLDTYDIIPYIPDAYYILYIIYNM